MSLCSQGYHMDDYSVKRVVDGFTVPRRSSGISLRDATEDRGQFCNRIGCKGRLNHTKASPSECSGKHKSSRTLPLSASNGKELIGSSTSTRSVVGGNIRKAVDRSQRSSKCFKSETDSSETTSSSVNEDEKHVSEIGKTSLVELGNSSVASPNSSSNRKKVYRQKPGIGTQSTLLGSSDVISSKNKVTNQGARSSAANTSRYGLRNLRCNSISDISPSGSSSSDSKSSKGKDLVKKRNSEVESSSSFQGKEKSGPFSEDTGYSTSNHGIRISDSRRGSSIHTQRSINGNNNTQTRRFPNRGSRREFPTVSPQSESSTDMELPFTPNQFLNDSSSSTHSMPFSRPGSSGWSLADIHPVGSRELGIPNPSLNLGGLRRHNIDGIAEALLAVERLEQDEELTFEQLMTLDANLFLGALGFYDQHREMRLDIDNMSYEELLVLEEKIGNVSTALSEEAITECLRSSTFQSGTFGEQSMRRLKGDENEVKCSICQEEYEAGDEVGRLKCEHKYHKACIQKWLRLKNWCPICKAPAAAPSPPA